jgi:hypothetical protein
VAGHVGDLGPESKARCGDCYRLLWRGGRCKRRDCPGYAPIYLRDQAERLRENLAAWDGKTCLVTLTAPGADVLSWDPAKCPSGTHTCSGRLGCRVDRFAAAVWNSTVTKRLGDLLKVARERVRRKHGRHAQVVVLAYVCESQHRGVFHPHVVLGYRTAADRAALETFVETLRCQRGAYAFGTGRRGSFDGGKPDRFTGQDAGRYISKYLRPDGAKTSFVPLLEAVNEITPRDPATGRHKQLVHPVYVSPILTRITGVTMGFLRLTRRAFMMLKAEHTRAELLVMYRIVRLFNATFDGYELPKMPHPPPQPPPLIPALPPPLTLFPRSSFVRSPS